ncbi:acyl-CoA dehydrogenase [Streptomyces sp. ACA25]|uniref:acyl-CoA dehydrogenase n=1 Tax=Streptomyces sp. ACA25 TaxID=3022596 RepID=UPI0023075673|nr:acyl-CoA dehydrogenase [Streptomyces sp. ACA25]MDB1089342.1 acyl-CoA dehydrogenase [Streptomyces sp. ACA25]
MMPPTAPAPRSLTSSPAVPGPPSLEALLGDPYDPRNPTGHDAFGVADDRGEPLGAGEAVLDSWSANAEYVPTALGGRLDGVDELVRRLRPVFRRDAGLGLGHGLTTLMAALNVWAAGDEDQRAHTAKLLLTGERISVAYHELAHGNDLTRNALRAVPGPGGYLLNGRKQVINNAGRARAAVVFARTAATDGPPGGRDHSLLLLDELDALPAGRFSRLPRFRTSGLAGCRLGGLAFDDCPVPAAALLGETGAGSAVALRSFQVSRAVTAGAGTSMLEGALFAVLRFAGERVLYGRPVTALPHARSLLAGAYADLHIAQAFARSAARALHLYPGAAGRYAAAAKYLVPLLVEDALGDLAVLLGARSYLREGPYAVVGRHLRDIAGLSIGHAGGMACRLTVLPELPGLDPETEPAGHLLFGSGPLPALDLGALRLRGTRADPLLASLPDEIAALPGDGAPHRPGSGLLAELGALRSAAAALPPGERGVTAGHRALRLADRYAWLLAAASCLGVYRHGPGRDAPDGMLGALLQRIGQRSGRLPATPATAQSDEVLLADLQSRAAAGTSFDLDPDHVSRQLVR